MPGIFRLDVVLSGLLRTSLMVLYVMMSTSRRCAIAWGHSESNLDWTQYSCSVSASSTQTILKCSRLPRLSSSYSSQDTHLASRGFVVCWSMHDLSIRRCPIILLPSVTTPHAFSCDRRDLRNHQVNKAPPRHSCPLLPVCHRKRRRTANLRR